MSKFVLYFHFYFKNPLGFISLLKASFSVLWDWGSNTYETMHAVRRRKRMQKKVCWKKLFFPL